MVGTYKSVTGVALPVHGIRRVYLPYAMRGRRINWQVLITVHGDELAWINIKREDFQLTIPTPTRIILPVLAQEPNMTFYELRHNRQLLVRGTFLHCLEQLAERSGAAEVPPLQESGFTEYRVGPWLITPYEVASKSPKI